MTDIFNQLKTLQKIQANNYKIVSKIVHEEAKKELLQKMKGELIKFTPEEIKVVYKFIKHIEKL